MDRNEREARIEEYGRGFGLLEAALQEIPREAWDFKPSPQDWSVHEIIVHMADSESMASLRVRKLIVEPGTELMGYDEARWAEALDYQHQDLESALAIIRLARQSTYRLLKSLPEDTFGHSVMHPEYSEPYTFEKWLKIYSNHIPDHVQQIRRAAEGWRESQK